ncbi:hypothetical protein SBA2_820002 [Acidobacteriia bacterium SbA2]|nr:hypothetical protein SBA2_820002 [Acidobacteriia bacterium SbA2]
MQTTPVDSLIGVQNLGQSGSGLSKKFDHLHGLYLPITLISKGECPREVWNQTCLLQGGR